MQEEQSNLQQLHFYSTLLPRDRHARRYLQEARVSAAELGGALHDPPAVARCLAAAETFLSGNASGHWAMPASLPSASTYQVQEDGKTTTLEQSVNMCFVLHSSSCTLFGGSIA